MKSASLLSLLLLCPATASAQSGPEGTAATGSLQVTLWGGWTSFAQKSVNDVIRLDNLLLTAPVDSGGAGLEEGITPLTDAPGGGVEVSWALRSGLRLVAGVQRLHDGSRVGFLFDDDGDPGTPPVPAYLDYEVGAWPVQAGLAWGFRMDERLEYDLSASLLYFPASELRVRGSIGGPAVLDEVGTASGLGAQFTWGGSFAVSGPVRAGMRVGLRLGRLGTAEADDGSPIMSAFGQELGLDWSGVDVQIGLIWTVF